MLKSDELVYLGETKRISQKTGNKYTLITLADPKKYENYDFFKRDDLVQSEEFSQGDVVLAEFELSKNGFNTNLNLVKLEGV